MAGDAVTFGSYSLLKRIARGGMAEVYLARQRGPAGFDRRVAVKRILPNLASSSEFVRMFLAEAKHAAQLTHPNIVHIYEFGKVGDDYFIAMEFVDGVHVGQLWTYGNSDVLPPALVARIGADAAAALHHAHELRTKTGQPLGLVHRDVSPANIMISFDGVVKLCDFGIAKAAIATDQLTQPGEVKGKYGYMSPEQCTAKALDGRSDVFSLCIVLWELLAARHCVPRGDAVLAMRMIRDGRLEPIALAVPSCPHPIAKAIAWGMEAKRENRPTAAELAHALEEAIKSSPVIATPMQLGAWIRQRHTRPTTGEMPEIGAFGELGVSESLAHVGSASVSVVTPSGLNDSGISEASFTSPSMSLDSSLTPSNLGASVTPTNDHDDSWKSGGIEVRETVVYERRRDTDKMAPNSTLRDQTLFDPSSVTPREQNTPHEAPTVLAPELDTDSRKSATVFHAGGAPPRAANQRMPTPPAGVAPPSQPPSVPHSNPPSQPPSTNPPSQPPRSPASQPPRAPTSSPGRMAPVPLAQPIRAMTAPPATRGPGGMLRALLGIEPRNQARLRAVIYGGMFLGFILIGVAIAFAVTAR